MRSVVPKKVGVLNKISPILTVTFHTSVNDSSGCAQDGGGFPVADRLVDTPVVTCW